LTRLQKKGEFGCPSNSRYINVHVKRTSYYTVLDARSSTYLQVPTGFPSLLLLLLLLFDPPTPVLIATALEVEANGGPVAVGANPPLELCVDSGAPVGAAFPVLACTTGVAPRFLLLCVTPTATPTTTPTSRTAATIMIAIPLVVRYHGRDCDLVTSFE